MGRQRQQPRIVADEDFGQRLGQQLTGSQHRHTGHRNDARTFAQQAFQLVLIVRAKVVADNGRCALRIADEHRREHKAHIHKHAVGRNAVRAEQLEQLHVVQRTDQRHRDIRHQLADAVGAGFEQLPQAEQRLCKIQAAAGTALSKVENGRHTADHLADDRRRRRTGQPKTRHADEHEVQHHVGRARRHREEQAQLGLFRGNKEALEQVLQHERRLECQQNAAIQQTAGQQLGRCAQQQRHGPQQCQADDAENRADAHSRNGQHTEQPVCALLIAHAQRHGDQRTAARADHKAEAAQHLDIGVNEVQRRERRFARAVRDKEAVHNRVDRREDHHDNGRRREFQQPPRGKVVGQLDLV